ncbi:MAG: DUF2752 domain-containing protein [Microlunatus sp.]|nr:DUF2752 domain-containing protein [Microlunatus sp.]
MTSVQTSERRPFQPLSGLRWLAGYAAFGLGISTLYAGTGVGFPCPFRELTGWECPFCGGTRLGSALLRGDVTAAIAYNPVVFASLVLGVLVGAVWLIEALGGPRVRPPRSWVVTAGRIRPAVWWVLVGLLTAAYVVLRNLL